MRADAVAKRQSLVTAARRLYAERGSDVPFSAIAAEADVGIATLYRHFPARSDLIVGIIEQVHAEIRELTARSVRDWDDQPEVNWLRFVRDVADLRLGALLPQLALTALTETPTAETARLRGYALEVINVALDSAKAAGLLRPEITADQFSLGLGIITRPLPEVPFSDVPTDPSWLIDVYIRGLHPDTK